ncbi:hypothetical protein ABPG74_020704 [Tetrahymena malaccensis]
MLKLFKQQKTHFFSLILLATPGIWLVHLYYNTIICLDYTPTSTPYSVLYTLKDNNEEQNRFFKDPRKILCILGQFENKDLLKFLFHVEQQSSNNDFHKIERFNSYYYIFQIISNEENVNLKTSVLSLESKSSNFELEFEKNQYLAKQIQKQKNILKLTEEYQLQTCDSLIYITNDYQIESKLKIKDLVQNNKLNKKLLIVHDLVFLDENYKRVYQNILKQSENLTSLSGNTIWRENNKQKNIYHIFVSGYLDVKNQYSNSFKKFLSQQAQNSQTRQEDLINYSKEYLRLIQSAYIESRQLQQVDEANKCTINHGLSKTITATIECFLGNQQILDIYLKEKKNLKQYLVIQLKDEQIEFVLYYPKNKILNNGFSKRDGKQVYIIELSKEEEIE